ncbi:hypothetical protein DMUE_2727 [Dictyocoela muelleri]|nr:hypothetical protein DMUE_2727 [Dictyocoela muelleri]
MIKSWKIFRLTQPLSQTTSEVLPYLNTITHNADEWTRIFTTSTSQLYIEILEKITIKIKIDKKEIHIADIQFKNLNITSKNNILALKNEYFYQLSFYSVSDMKECHIVILRNMKIDSIVLKKFLKDLVGDNKILYCNEFKTRKSYEELKDEFLKIVYKWN